MYWKLYKYKWFDEITKSMLNEQKINFKFKVYLFNIKTKREKKEDNLINILECL